MSSKFHISREEAQIVTHKANEEMNAFFKKHCLNTSDVATLILKTHLYVEMCLNKMISLMLPNSKTIVDKKFSDKLDIFEALSNHLPPYHSIIIKMRALNKLRNSFAHKLDMDLKNHDIAIFINNIDTNSKLSVINKLKHGFIHFLMYMHFVMVYEEHFPFIASYNRNNKIFTRDKCYPDESAINIIYPINELRKVLNYFRIGK